MSAKFLALLLAAGFSAPCIFVPTGNFASQRDTSQMQDPLRAMPKFQASDNNFSSERTGNYFALVIGINDYLSLEKLRTPLKDAEDVAAILHDRYGFETRVLRNAN